MNMSNFFFTSCLLPGLSAYLGLLFFFLFFLSSLPPGGELLHYNHMYKFDSSSDCLLHIHLNGLSDVSFNSALSHCWSWTEKE